MCGPLHLYFNDLLGDTLPVLVEDNAKTHKSEEPVQQPADTEIRRAMSTGSITGCFLSKWDTGTSCLEAPKILSSLSNNPEEEDDDDDDVLDIEDLKWLTSLQRTSSTGSLNENQRRRALSRWDSSSCLLSVKKDDAAKKPLRKLVLSKKDEEITSTTGSSSGSSSSPQCIKVVISILDDVGSSSSMGDRCITMSEIPKELFRAH